MRSRQNVGFGRCRLLLGVCLAYNFPSVLGAAPSWWNERGVIAVDPGTGQPMAANDYAAANQGQVKNIALAAVAELNARLPGGAGKPLNDFAKALADGEKGADDYATVNLGQLKAVARPFYDRLIAVGYAKTYPWTSAAQSPGDYAVANIGQVKNLFSFDLVHGENRLGGDPKSPSGKGE